MTFRCLIYSAATVHVTIVVNGTWCVKIECYFTDSTSSKQLICEVRHVFLRKTKRLDVFSFLFACASLSQEWIKLSETFQ